jgi:hypothetical protein
LCLKGKVTTVLLGLGLATLTAVYANADKVGVAAAVHPDAFSDGSEIKIGKAIFFNERINTSGQGLVQVLLLDGSTFTVGPGSDLVIDKFVYDPRTNQGQMTANSARVSCASRLTRASKAPALKKPPSRRG